MPTSAFYRVSQQWSHLLQIVNNNNNSSRQVCHSHMKLKKSVARVCHTLKWSHNLASGPSFLTRSSFRSRSYFLWGTDVAVNWTSHPYCASFIRLVVDRSVTVFVQQLSFYSKSPITLFSCTNMDTLNQVHRCGTTCLP